MFGLTAALVILDLFGRLALPFAAIAMTTARPTYGLIAATLSVLTGGLRAELLGRHHERALVEVWQKLVSQVEFMSVTRLQQRHAGDESVTALIEGAYSEVEVQSQLLPSAFSYMIAVVVLAAAAFIRLGPAIMLLGVGLLVPVAAVVLWSSRRLGVLADQQWDGYRRLTARFQLILVAAAELRGNQQQQPVRRDMDRATLELATIERGTRRVGAVTSTIPLALMASGAAVAQRINAFGVPLAGGGSKTIEAAVIGGALVWYLVALVRSYQSFRGYSASRRTLRDFLGGSRSEASPQASPAQSPKDPIQVVSIQLRDVGVTYRGSERATPAAVNFDWKRGHSHVLVGDNGSGKTTLAHVILGLTEPTAGEVTIAAVDGVAVSATAATRPDFCFLPQRPFVGSGESIAWHLRLWQPDATDAAIEAALRETKVWRALTGRHQAPLTTPLSALSGGERQRVHFARLLLTQAQWLVVDEPEASVDSEGRDVFRRLLARLAESRQVLLIAHDPAVIPKQFETHQLT